MRCSVRSLAIAFALLASAAVVTGFNQAPDDCEFIRLQIDALPTGGGVIQLPAGIFECKAKIVLKKSNVTISGAGRTLTTLRLANFSEDPLLVIGDDRVILDNETGNWVTATRVANIVVSDLTVDGNLANQDPFKECGKGSCSGDVSNIRNNAITIRGASYVTLLRVTAHSAISGGLVTEKYCDHLHVKDFSSYGNYFDGFAGYQTEQSLFENLDLSHNRGAGISIDIDFNENRFLNGTLTSNGDVGIFARFLHGVVFENLVISGSGNHGAFLAQSGHADSCANDNEFRSVTVEGSNGFGIYLASACTGNKVTGTSLFQNNKSGCMHVNSKTSMQVDSTVQCLN
ncbi:MAG: right-handed parallel beta-helix repeat-containing protein [Proteobacteria bacterium]|nr:MAG: right-handed parallel beta-helix repeat-containing protein [Pseudomonadota bacterium]